MRRTAKLCARSEQDTNTRYFDILGVFSPQIHLWRAAVMQLLPAT